MADALDSKSGFSNEVWVQVPSPVPRLFLSPEGFSFGLFCLLQLYFLLLKRSETEEYYGYFKFS